MNNGTMMRTSAMTILLIVGALFITGCGPADDKNKIIATGTVEMTETSVSGKVSGKVVNIMVQEGQTVKQGMLLAELDHEELDAQIVAARSNLELAKERYRTSSKALNLSGNSGSGSARQAQIALAQNNVATAKANLDQADLDLKRIQKLYQDQLVSRAEFDQIMTRRTVAASQYQAALSQLEVAKTSPGADDIDLTAKGSQTQIDQAQSSLTLLETQVKNTKIYAPADGVISNRLVEPGEVVAAGSPLFMLSDYDKPWVKVYLPLPDMERVILNQDAVVILDAFPNKKFHGRVIFISTEAEFTPKNYQSKEERVKQVYAIKVQLENSQGLFKAGLPVDVRLTPRKVK